MLRFTPLPTSNVPPSLLAGRRLALIQPLLTVRLVPTHGCVAVMQPSRSLRPRQRSGHSRSCDRAPCSERTAKSARLLRQKTRPLVQARRCRTSAMWETPRSANTPTLVRAQSLPTTTVSTSTTASLGHTCARVRTVFLWHPLELRTGCTPVQERSSVRTCRRFLLRGTSLHVAISGVGLGSFELAPTQRLLPGRQPRHPEPTDNDPAMAAGEERDVGYQNQWVKASRARVWARAPCSRRADRRGARVGFGAHRLPYLCER